MSADTAPRLLLDALVESLVAGPGRRVVVRDRRTCLTSDALLAGARTVADALPAACPGLPARPRVAVVAPNSAHYVSVLLGLLSAGALPVLVDPTVTEHQLRALVEQTGLDAVVRAAAASPTASPLAHGFDVEPFGRTSRARPPVHGTTELCRLTSGTTRTPGCLEFSGAAVLAAAGGWLRAGGLDHEDRVLCLAGAYNGLAFNTSIVPGLLAGCTLVLPSGPPTTSSVRRLLAEHDPTVLVAFPAVYDGIARAGAGHELARVRSCLSSAAPLSAATRDALRTAGAVVADYYGLAETGPLTAGSDGAPGQGPLLDHVDARVVDGELSVRSASMATRYLNYPGELESRLDDDGYYRTGDEGTVAQGRLVLGERLGKGLNVAGRKVGPGQVRDALLGSQALRDAHVLLHPAAPGSDVVLLTALVVPADADDAAELPARLQSHVRGVLAPHERPQHYVVVDAIPRSGSGKPRTHEITALLPDTAAEREERL